MVYSVSNHPHHIAMGDCDAGAIYHTNTGGRLIIGREITGYRQDSNTECGFELHPPTCGNQPAHSSSSCPVAILWPGNKGNHIERDTNGY